MKCTINAALMAALLGLGLASNTQAQTVRRAGLFQRRIEVPATTYYNRGYTNQAMVAYPAQPATYTYTQPTAPAAPATVTYTQPITSANTNVTPPAAAYVVPDGVTESWVWLASEGVWGYGYQISSGTDKGLWKVRHRVQPDGERPAPASAASTEAVSYGDSYGFVAILNQIRAQNGLPAVAYDSNLSAWASQNNAAQSQRGLGHFVNPGTLQNSGWNYADAASVAAGWMGSPGHRATMLAWVTRVGIAYGPGPYWTMNAQ